MTKEEIFNEKMTTGGCIWEILKYLCPLCKALCLESKQTDNSDHGRKRN